MVHADYADKNRTVDVPVNQKEIQNQHVSQHNSNEMLPAVLRLTLKKKWFDMIAAGIKKEEYREWKPYWFNRLKEKVLFLLKPLTYCQNLHLY